MGAPKATEKMSAYFSKIQASVEREYAIAKEARSRLLDPTNRVETALASDAAARVEGLLATIYPSMEGSGLAERIRDLEKTFGKGSERISFQIAREVYEEKFVKFPTVEARIEAGVRVGMGHLTLGVVTAPLEGITKVVSKQTRTGGKYSSIYFSGPIRSAGGTAAAFAVLIADFLRRLAGFDAYDPDQSELERYAAEIDDYDTRIVNLQYRIKGDEVKFLAKGIPIEISGDPTEEDEVIAFKDLPRVETNRIRGGMCLVVSSIGQKSSKLIKKLKQYSSEFLLSDWIPFLESYETLKKQIHSADAEKVPEKKDATLSLASLKLPPNFTYMEDVPGGRPIFSFPSTPGGFRLRYGRARNTGFSCDGIHPATTAILSDFIAIGTQLKIERPGKGATAAIVDSIEPPVVLLSTGEVKKISNPEDARKLLKENQVKEILFIGDILISYGDFVSNGHKLVPAGYCEEIWLLEIGKAMELSGLVPESAAAFLGMSPLRLHSILDSSEKPSFDEAVAISTKMKVAIHPEFNYFYHRVQSNDLFVLCNSLESGDALSIENSSRVKRTLELMCFPHTSSPDKDRLVFPKDHARALRMSLAIDSDPGAFKAVSVELSPLEYVNSLSKIKIADKGGTYIGARMGRPEKAERRLLDGRPQVLFPVGQAGGRLRSVNEAAKTIYNAPLAHRVCSSCGKRNIFLKCSCGGETSQKRVCPICQKITDEPIHCGVPTGFHSSADVSLDRHLKASETLLKERAPSLIKGVRGLSSRLKIPERIEKGMLRAKHNLFVNKDGTIRFDSTDLPLTHFKPKETGISIEKLIKLGYDKDIDGEPLSREDQVLELKPQDIFISDFEDQKRGIMSGAEYFVRVASYVDDLLSKFYGLAPYYNIATKEDLAGHLVIGLAPHTSAGIVGRIIGFNKARAGFAHPMFHAAKRRDCDGDEDSVLLLMESLLDFSREFLPNTRGSSTMDVPLVLTTILDPSEVDDQVHELDIATSYSLDLYQKAAEYASPTSMEKPVERLKNRIGKPGQFEGLGYTHPTSSITNAMAITKYRSLGAMVEKVTEQLGLAERVTAVNEHDVANLILSTHFIKDIKGNMRTFCRQSFRCVKCNEKYRRVPLAGKCLKCKGKLVLTVHQGTIEKYLEASKRIAEKYNVPPYMKQELLILQKRLSAMFGKENQKSLDSFFSKAG